MNENSSTAKVSLTPGSVFQAALVLILLYVLFLLRDLVLVVLTAIVVASAIEPGTKWFVRRRVPRLLGVITIYLSVAILLFALFYFVLPSFLTEISNFIGTVPELFASLDIAEYFSGDGLAVGSGSSGNFVDGIQATLSAGDRARGFANFITSIPGSVFGTVSAVFGGVLSFVLIIVISFYLSVQESGIDNFLRIIIPAKHEKYAIDLWRRSQKRIGMWMQGQLLLMLIIGVLVYLSLTILGIERAFLFAVLAAIFELIPLFGPILASIPAIATAFMGGGLSLSLIVAGVYIIIQQFENHLIYPLVVNKVVGVPALLVILALIVGAKLAGFLGILLAVPLVTALMEFTNDVGARKRISAQRSADA